jgi:hypothetical protein
MQAVPHLLALDAMTAALRGNNIADATDFTGGNNDAIRFVKIVSGGATSRVPSVGERSYCE